MEEEDIPSTREYIKAVEQWVFNDDPSAMIARAGFCEHTMPKDKRLYLQQVKNGLAYLEKCLVDNKIVAAYTPEDELADQVADMTV